MIWQTQTLVLEDRISIGGSDNSGDGSSTISNGDATQDAFDDQLNNELSGGGDDDDDDGGSDFSFPGDEAFDDEFYLEQNPDVAEAGVDPGKHYYETGFKEGRDPNKIFDTDFYLAQNPDVAQDGVNPLKHYRENGRNEEGRYQNQVLQSFGKSSEAILVGSDLNNVDYSTIKSFVNNAELEGTEVAALPIVLGPFILEGVKVIAITAASLGIAKSVNNIQELLQSSDIEVFTVDVDADDFNASTPPFDLGEVTKVNEAKNFPSGNDFLEDLLDGKFEFPVGNQSLFTGNLQSINNGDSDIINDDSFWDDSDVLGDVSVPGVLNPEANDIANGHAFPKHRNEFPGVETREDFAKKIDEILNDPTVETRDLENERRAYWEEATGTLVIVDPSTADGGTMFKPEEGKDKFDDLI